LCTNITDKTESTHGVHLALIKARDEKDKIFAQITNHIISAHGGRQKTDDFIVGEKVTNAKQPEHGLQQEATKLASKYAQTAV